MALLCMSVIDCDRYPPLPSATSSLCGLYSLTALLLAELVFRVASRTAFYKRASDSADPAWKWCADTHAHTPRLH